MFLVRAISYGGAERQLLMLAAGLSKRHRVSVVSFYGDDGSIPLPPEVDSIAFHSLNKSGRWDLLGFASRFREMVRRLDPDVIYGFMNTAGLLSLLAASPGGHPRRVWGIRSSNLDQSQYGWLHRVLRSAECRMSEFADLAISNSHTGRAEALRDGYRVPIEVVPNGIDPSVFRFDREARNSTRDTWGIDDGVSVVGILARHDPMKGYEDFISAAALVAAERPDVLFVAAGDGPTDYSNELEERARAAGLGSRMKWLGRTTRISDFWSSVDLATSTSVWGEGFSNSLGEAMSCGLPCVATDVGDARFVVGDTGAIVPAGDPRAIARAWTRLLAEMPLWDRGNCPPRRRILEFFSPDLSVERTEALLHRLLS